MKNKLNTIGFNPNERNIFFHILTACNLSCSHCYINPLQHGEKTLSKKQIENWLKLFYNPNKKSNIIFLGGEPTIHPDLASLVKTAKKLGYFVSIDSNGYLFNDLLHKTSPLYLDSLNFSLDGHNPKTNDALRGKGCFKICTDNIKKAVKLSYNTSVIFTVSNQNIDYLIKMANLLKKLKTKRLFIQIIGLRGRSSNSAKTIQVTRKQWLNTIPFAAKKIAQKGINVIYPKVFLKTDELFECAGNTAENYFIFPNGRVYKCPICEDYPIHTYQIKKNKLIKRNGLIESNFFKLNIKEGCAMNKLLQPATIEYDKNTKPLYKISCCLLKREIKAINKK